MSDSQPETLPEANEKFSIFKPDGGFRSVAQVLETLQDLGIQDAREQVLASNIEFLRECGCDTEEQVNEGFELMCSLNLETTFNPWSNEEEGSSGISARNLIGLAEKPGALLCLVGLLKSHVDASASGTLTVSFNNPVRGAGGRRRR